MRNDQFAGTFIDTGEETAQHNSIGTGGESFGDVARILDASISAHRDIMETSGTCTVINGGDLRHTTTGNETTGAELAGAHTPLSATPPACNPSLAACAC